MKHTDIPKKHPIPFANAGDKNTIPQSGVAAGAATLTDGFPPETMVPVIAGGIPPDGKDMNGVLFELSDMGRWANAGAEYTFDQGFCTAIGGYPAGARLLSSDGKSVFISEVDDNTANPEAVSDKWVGFSNYRGAITATTGVHTLTALEASRDLIVVSGTLTGNVQLVFPAWVKHWQIINSTTGNFSVTCKTATGSGVVVKGGFLTDIYGDGTSISSHANTDVAGVVRSVNNHGPGANGEVTLTANDVSALRQIPLQSGSATHWLKIATMPPVVNSETRLEIELSGMSDYGVNATGMAVDRVYITTRGTSASTRVTAATVGNLIQQFSLGRSVDTQNYLVGVTEEVSSGNTTKYNFWLKMSNHTGISSTMNILNSRYSGVTVISDFSGANNSATEPAGIVYATRQQFFTTANPQQAADVRNNAAARMGVPRVLTGATGPSSPGVWSVENSTWAGAAWGSVICTTNGSDLSTAGGSGKFNHYLQISHEAGGKPGLRVAINVNGAASGWSQVMMTSGGTFTGPITAPNFASTPDAMPVGAGTYADQLSTQAPFFQPNWQWPVTSGGVFVPIAKGTSTRKDKGWPTAITYGYLMPGEDMHAHPVIHALGDSGMENIWEFDTQSGGLRSGKAGEFATQAWVNSHCPFPVGYFMLMGNNSDPNVIYPGTAWQDMTASYDSRVLSLGFDPLGTGGSNTVTLGVEHMPPHSHNLKAYHSNTSLDGGWSSRYSVDPTEGSEANDVITSTGGGQSFNVTNAYVHVRGWMRTA